MSTPSHRGGESIGALEFPPTTAEVRTLGNGLEVIVKEDRAAPVVSLQAWCRAGSIHEGEWLGAGMSHFLEHMLFKGTEKRDAARIAMDVQSAGGYVNAYTSFDRTVYWIDAPAEGADACLEVLCDMVGFASIPEDEFASESDVIRREITMGEDNPDQVLSRALFRAAYAVHPCRHPVIGYRDLFDQLSRDDLYSYYREKYSPDNLFFVVVGDVETDRVFDSIERHLGELTRRRRFPDLVPIEPPQLGIRRDRIGFPTDLSRNRLAFPAPDGSHPDTAALDIAVALLGDGRSSRLYREIREKAGLAHAIGAYCYTPSFRGQVVVSFETMPEKSGAAEAAVFSELERFLEEGPSEAELAKARAQGLSSQFSTLSTVRDQASDLGSNWHLARNLDLTADYVRDLRAVDAEAVRRVAREYFTLDRYTRVSLLPEDASVPVKKGSVAKRSEDVRLVELENGLTALILADHRVPVVESVGYFRGGLLAETPATNGATRLMARLLAKDSRRRSSDEIAEAIESVGGSIGASVGNNTFGMSVQALRPDLALAIDLLGETVLEPAFSPEQLSAESGFQLAQIRKEKDRPFTVAMRALRDVVYGEHPYALSSVGTEEALAGLGRDEIAMLHSRLVVGGNGIIGVFGDLDPARAEDLVRERFGGSMPAGPRQFAEPLPIALPDCGGRTIELSHEKEQAILLIGFRTVPLHHEDNSALEMIDEACSDMASRMFVRIREELGLAYSVGASRLVGLEPGLIVFYASTAPEKLDLVESEMRDEIAQIRENGLTDEELSRAKTSWIGRDAVHLQGVHELASTATIDELVGLGWDHYRKAPDRIRGIGSDEIKAVAARYLGEENAVVVRLGG